MTQNAGTILIVDDDHDVLLAARLLLKQHNYQVYTEEQPRRLPALLRERTYDVILLDMNFTEEASGGGEGFYWLQIIRALDPEAKVVFITAYGDVEMAVRAMRTGASNFVLKPWHNEELLDILANAVARRRSAPAP